MMVLAWICFDIWQSSRWPVSTMGVCLFRGPPPSKPNKKLVAFCASCFSKSDLDLVVFAFKPPFSVQRCHLNGPRSPEIATEAIHMLQRTADSTLRALSFGERVKVTCHAEHHACVHMFHESGIDAVLRDWGSSFARSVVPSSF